MFIYTHIAVVETNYSYLTTFRLGDPRHKTGDLNLTTSKHFRKKLKCFTLVNLTIKVKHLVNLTIKVKSFIFSSSSVKMKFSISHPHQSS